MLSKEEYKSGFVAVIGRPNVGKSTLINSLIGQKVLIMSDKAQTTRNRIQCILTRDDAQIIFIDTPGVHKPKHLLGEYMLEATKSALEEVEAILFVVELDTEYGSGDKYIASWLENIKTPVFLVCNKVDKLAKEKIPLALAATKELGEFTEIIPVSALNKDNIDIVIERIVSVIPEGPQYFPPDMVTEQPERFVVAELIREKILHLTREEIPHSIAVSVEEMRQGKSDDTTYISAIIYVERDSQKGIVIGKGGEMLKKVGALARTEMESLFATKVFLDLRVKVKKDWRDRTDILRTLGYSR